MNFPREFPAEVKALRAAFRTDIESLLVRLCTQSRNREEVRAMQKDLFVRVATFEREMAECGCPFVPDLSSFELAGLHEDIIVYLGAAREALLYGREPPPGGVHSKEVWRNSGSIAFRRVTEYLEAASIYRGRLASYTVVDIGGTEEELAEMNTR